MSDNPLTWPMIAALPIEAGELSETMLAAVPCSNGPLTDGPAAADLPSWAMRT